jgi:uncharacterized protein (DUF1501 family)
MLDLGSFAARLCDRPTRRAFLRAGTLAPFALSQPLAAAEPARARSIILLWLWGAPSHLDTFDPKPNAPAEYRGPFRAIPTRTPGVRLSELLPRVAARSHLYTLIRSHKNHHSGHTEAGTLALTGGQNFVGTVAPNFGAAVARARGGRDLPPFMAIGRGVPRDVVGIMHGYGGGVWGKTHDPFPLTCTDQGAVDIPALQLLAGLTPNHLRDRRVLLAGLDRLHRAADAGLDRWDATQQRAYALLTRPEARKALDLAAEDERTRAAYGFTAFGQSCLLARKLAEAGVPYVQVNWSQYVETMTPNCDFGWDTHIYNFETLTDRHCPILDRALAALLDDLHARGLLETTLVVAMGEFGRTPRINGQASRDHWPNCYGSLWAGAGLAGGRVVGESDARGEEPLTEPITPAMVGATLLELAGIGSQARAELGVLGGGRVLHELL